MVRRESKIASATGHKPSLLLCYIAFGPTPIGYNLFGDNSQWGYDSTPARLKDLISAEEFIECMNLLSSGSLINQYRHESASEYSGDPIQAWQATPLGKRVVREMLDVDSILADRASRSIAGFSELIISKLTIGT